MKKRALPKPFTSLIIVFFILAFRTNLSFAGNRYTFNNNFGVGVMLGEPTGFSWKHYLSKENGIAGGVAFSIGHTHAAYIHADYLWHKYGLFTDIVDNYKELTVYFGAGGRMLFADDFHLGIRAPVGLLYSCPDYPLEPFAEIVPVLDLTPNAALHLNIAIGLRYYFN